MKIETITIPVSESIGSVSAELMEPGTMKALLVFAHGAGAGMSHRFMKGVSKSLADLEIGTLRYNFPYMEKGKGRPDPPAIAEKTVSMVLNHAKSSFPSVPLLAGGNSFGGRMTSQFVSKEKSSGLKGIVFFGFPLHAPGKPSADRAAHLSNINVPMLFLQGTRDALANLELIRKLTSSLPTATLRLFEGADHSFTIGKKELIAELAEETAGWLKSL
jgi:uncharacterized protein